MKQLPGPQGLYHPSNEHDSCGVAFVVDMHGRRSRDIVEKAITALVNQFYAEVQAIGGGRQDTSALVRRLPNPAKRK